MEDANPYLALRQAKIARNQARLKELGLFDIQSKASQATVVTTHKRPIAPLASASTPAQPTRRSKRLSREPPTRLSLHPEETKPTLQSRKRPKQKHSSSSSSSPPPPPAHSVRNITLHIDPLLSQLLGNFLPKTGKQHVIDTCYDLASTKQPKQSIHKLSFNKYSGVQEWKNILFLWINFGAPNSDVINAFSPHNDDTISWFGGSRMHSETSVIQRLQDPSQTVLLWCREYQPSARTFTPYVCFGRLEYKSHNVNVHPIEFVWKLRDAQVLKEKSEVYREWVGKYQQVE